MYPTTANYGLVKPLISAIGSGPEINANWDTIDSALKALSTVMLGTTVRTIAAKLSDLPTIKDYGAACDGVTDDTAACNAMAVAMGSFLSPPLGTTVQGAENGAGNLGQAAVRFPAGVMVRITAPIVLPPGVALEGENSTLIQAVAGQDAVQVVYENGVQNSFYGVYRNAVRNLTIQGPGTSTKASGIFCCVANGAFFSNVLVSGFWFGVKLQEQQYSKFDTVQVVDCKVGLYITSRTPTGSAPYDPLPSIDNEFANCRFGFCSKYNIWIQCGSNNKFSKTDANFGGGACVVLGPQLSPYAAVASFTPGAGYTANATVPLVFSDATGTQADGFAQINATGNVSGVFITRGGRQMTAPTATIPGGTATVTLAVVNDSGLGDWDGVGTTIRGMNNFDDLKCEVSGTGTMRPACGYAIVIGDSSQGLNRFTNLSIGSDGGRAGGNWFSWMFNAGFGNILDKSGQPDDVPNPSTGDYGLIRNVTYGGIIVNWPSVNTLAHGMQYVINAAGTPDVGGPSFIEGSSLSTKFMQLLLFMGGYFGNDCLQAQQYSDAFLRFAMDLNGDMRWGSGSSAPDTTLSRVGVGTLSTPGTMEIGVLQLVPLATPPAHSYDQSFFTANGMIGVNGGYLFFRDGSNGGAVYRVQGSMSY
jgi:hypothetical protein